MSIVIVDYGIVMPTVLFMGVLLTLLVHFLAKYIEFKKKKKKKE